MGTYNLPRNVKGEGRILFIFTTKSLIYSAIGGTVGLIFYFILAAMQLGFVGILSVLICAVIGFGIGRLKVPNIGIIKATKVVSGENLDDVIMRAIKFKQKKNKIYIYDDKEEKTDDR